VRFSKYLVVVVLAMTGCRSDGGSNSEDLPIVTVPPTTEAPTTSVAPTTSAVDLLNILVEIFPFENAVLQVGDCYDIDFDAEPVECESPHDGQVISTSAVLSSSLIQSIDEDAWFEAIDIACVDEFESFLKTGYDYGTGQYVIDAIIKSADPLTIYCTVVSSDGEKWIGSAEVVIGSYDNVEFGDCFDPPTKTDDALVIPCSRPHYAEMFLVDAKIGLDDVYATYPTDDEWDEITDRICLNPFKRYTGKSIDDVNYSIALIFPLEYDWAQIENRVVSCAITSGTGAKWVGSKRK
jgi:hypothetical protein